MRLLSQGPVMLLLRRLQIMASPSQSQDAILPQSRGQLKKEGKNSVHRNRLHQVVRAGEDGFVAKQQVTEEAPPASHTIALKLIKW